MKQMAAGELFGAMVVEAVRSKRRVCEMAVELLRGCGMILRSEKRLLLGAEASGVLGLLFGACDEKNPEAASALARFSLDGNSYTAYSRGDKSVVPLLNLFVGACV